MMAPLFLLPAFVAMDSSSCMQRQQFFQNTDDGTLALIRDAHSPTDAATLYSGWCPVANGTTQEQGGDKVYFGLNNRADSARQPRYYIVKIFRRSQATALRPLLSLRRIGDWRNGGCPGQSTGGPYTASMAGQGVVQGLVDLAKRYQTSADGGGCDALRKWFASAFGVPSLSTADQAGFIADLPRRVSDTGVQNWSLSVTAFSYGTVADDDRTADFPRLVITRNGADEIIVQYVSSGSKYHEFALVAPQ